MRFNKDEAELPASSVGLASGLDGAGAASPASESSHRTPCFSDLRSSTALVFHAVLGVHLRLLAAFALIWPHVPPFIKTSDVLRVRALVTGGRVSRVQA